VSAPCTQEHAEWLALALADGLDAVPEAPRRGLAGCTACSAELASLGTVQARIVRAGVRQSRVLTAARGEARGEDERLVRELHQRSLARGAGTSAGSRRMRWIRSVAVLAAAAALVALLLRPTGGGETAPAVAPEVLLGDRELEWIEPGQGGALSDVVEWRDDSGETRRYRVEVRGLVEGRLQRLRSAEIHDATRWTLDRAEVNSWPQSLLLTIQAFSMDGQPIEGAALTREVRRADS
jgi:hypothetical protein